jgi:hypothetical protein
VRSLSSRMSHDSSGAGGKNSQVNLRAGWKRKKPSF